MIRLKFSPAALMRASSSTCTVCRSFSVALFDVPEKAPHYIQWRALPRRGQRARSFFSFKLCLGLSVLPLERRLILSAPVLPEFLRQVTIQRLHVGEACLD